MVDGTASKVVSANGTTGAQGSWLLNKWRQAYLKSEGLRGYTLLSPALFLMVLSVAVPLLLLVVVSFWTQHLLDITPGFVFDNYLTFFEKDSYQRLLLRSLKISGFVTIFTVLLAYPMAYFIAFRVKKNKLMWIILITVPFWTSYLLRVFAWKIILGYSGVVNSGLMTMGWIQAPLEFLLYNQFAVVLTLAHAWAAFAILPIYVSLEKMDKTLLEAATVLGDGPVMRFFRVTLPLSMPGVVAASLLVFIPTVGDFVTPALLGGPKGLMIGNLIQLQFAKANNWPLGAALSIISLMAITLCVCAFLWFSKRVRTQDL
ncbi:MAG: ABC transporter permease [Pseudomonadota bacterium]